MGDRGLEQVAGHPPVAEPAMTREGVEVGAERREGTVVGAVAATVTLHLEDGDDFLGGVVREVDGAGKAGLQPGVGRDQVGHLIGVPGHDDGDTIAPVLDQLDDGVDGLPPEVRFRAPDQGVGLVDQEHPTVGAVEGLDDLGRGLADEAGDQAGSIDLDQMPAFDDAERAVDLCDQPGDGGLAGARVAREHQMARLFDHGEAAIGAQDLDASEVGDPGDLGLDLGVGHDYLSLLGSTSG